MRWPHLVWGTDDQRIAILQSKVRSMGRIIQTTSREKARLSRALWAAELKAKGQPLPRLVNKWHRVCNAAETNSPAKIIELINKGKEQS